MTLSDHTCARRACDTGLQPVPSVGFGNSLLPTHAEQGPCPPSVPLFLPQPTLRGQSRDRPGRDAAGTWGPEPQERERTERGSRIRSDDLPRQEDSKKSLSGVVSPRRAFNIGPRAVPKNNDPLHGLSATDF